MAKKKKPRCPWCHNHNQGCRFSKGGRSGYCKTNNQKVTPEMWASVEEAAGALLDHVAAELERSGHITIGKDANGETIYTRTAKPMQPEPEAN
jgi:hypothetical protein